MAPFLSRPSCKAIGCGRDYNLVHHGSGLDCARCILEALEASESEVAALSYNAVCPGRPTPGFVGGDKTR